MMPKRLRLNDMENKQQQLEPQNTFPNDLFTLAWNASVGYSRDKNRNHPFVTQAGTKSH